MNLCQRTLLVAALSAALSPCLAMAQRPSAGASDRDAAWTRAFAVPFSPHAADGQGNAPSLTIDPRFEPLLKASFPQRQWFWYDHGRLVSTADLIRTYMSTSGGAILDEGRYVTADGCVPHVCDALHGMLWIDTGVHPAELIFAGTILVSGNGEDERYHLWIFSSTKLNWQHLPPSFLISLPRWLSTIRKLDNGTNRPHFKFALVTIVQPNGIMEDLTPETLPLGTIEIGAKQ
jgi:hypothetical protein